MAKHHPSKALFPNWTLDVGNNHFHRTLTIAQRMKETDENLATLRALIDALEFEYLMKRRVRDELDEMGG